ncbi:MAG: hypothetical protein K0S32_2954 [Bacteroidetes bacterium]|jgi:hypothetical protein|nr:hypothetical protein [Bacteroidota bacterium]
MRTKFFLFVFILSFFGIKCQVLPSYSVTVLDTASKGYYFMIPLKSGAALPGYTLTQSILDRSGNLVYYKKFPLPAIGDFKMHSNGLMSYSWKGKFYLMDSTFTIKDSVTTQNGVPIDSHDFQILPNGHFVLLGIENVTMDLSAYNYFGANHTLAGSPTATVKCGVIQELDVNKNVVFEWHCKDHYNFSDVDPQWLLSPSNVDWTHLNAVEYDNDGNYMLSVRHFNEITKIKRSDSTIMWRMGGNANQFTFTNDPGMFIGQHDIRRVSNGNVTLNDNGRQTPFHVAAAKEYQLNESAKTATLAWSYVEDNTTYSRAIGNYQKLLNGNHVINYGFMNNKYHLFNVVKSNGSKVFEMRFADTLRSYRVFNYPTLPWSLNQPTLACSVSGTNIVLDAGTHSGYLWSNGATTQTILVANTGTYSVWVPRGQGGFISSQIYTVNISAPCLFTDIKKNDPVNSVKVFPNPFSDKLEIESDGNDSHLEIFNCVGQKIHEEKTSQKKTEISTSQFPTGMYFLKVNNKTTKLLKQ